MLNALFSNFANHCSGESSFFKIPTWYQYLELVHDAKTGRCEVPADFGISDFPLIALAFVDIGLRVAALVAIGYVIYGGVQFVIAQGESDKVKRARQTIINALIGLVVAMIATALVAFIGVRLGHGERNPGSNPLPDVAADQEHLQTLINTVLGISGAIAVLIVVLAGLRLIFSQGDPGQVSTARNAIIYSLIGLVIIMFVFAIVNFVVLGVG